MKKVLFSQGSWFLTFPDKGLAEEALNFLQHKYFDGWALQLVIRDLSDVPPCNPSCPVPIEEPSKTNLQASQPPCVVGSQITDSQTQAAPRPTPRFPAPLIPPPNRFGPSGFTILQELPRAPAPFLTPSTQLQPPPPSQTQPPKSMGPPPSQLRPSVPSTQLQTPLPSQTQPPSLVPPQHLPAPSQHVAIPTQLPPASQTTPTHSLPSEPPRPQLAPVVLASQSAPTVQPTSPPPQAPPLMAASQSVPTATERSVAPRQRTSSQRPTLPSTQRPLLQPEEPIFVPDSPEPDRDKRKPAPPSNYPSKRRRTNAIDVDADCLASSEEDNTARHKAKTPPSSHTISTTNNNNNNYISNNNNHSMQSPSKSQAIPSSQQRDDNLCPICFDNYAITGSHRICCLKCGHLFGKSCIEKWLKNNKKCPSCNAKARSADIRLLYVNKITAVDSSEVQFAVNQLKKEQQARAKIEAEKQGVERELATLQSKYTDLKRKMRELQDTVAKQQLQVDHVGETATADSVTAGSGAIQKLRMPTRTKKSGPPLQKLPGFSNHSALPSPVKPSKTESTNEVSRISSSPPCNNNNNNAHRAFHNNINNNHHQQLRYGGEIPPPVSLSGLSANSNTSSYFTPSTVPIAPPSEVFHNRKHSYKFINKIDLQGGRVLDWNSHEGLLVVSSLKPGSIPSSLQTSNSYGITKFSALDCANPDFISLHDKMIRDVKFQPMSQSGLLMTTSLDKTLKLVNFKTNNVVHTFHLATAAWACEWNAEDPNFFYCGQQKSITMFDIRKTDSFVAKFEALHVHPTSSISFVSASPHPNCRNKTRGLLTSSTPGVFFYDIDDNYKCHRLPLDGTCTHATSDPTTGFFVASFRNTPLFSKPCHTVFELIDSSSVKELRTLHLDSCAAISQQVLSRSLIFSASTEGYPSPSQDYPSRLMVAAGDEKTFNVMLWDCTEGYLIEKLCSHATPVLDLKHFGDRFVNFLTSLSETQLFIHKLQ